jgi:pilus assembly protein TadC
MKLVFVASALTAGAVVASVGAVMLRDASLLAGFEAVPSPRRRRWLDEVGAAPLVRSLVGRDRLQPLLDAADRPISSERVAGTVVLIAAASAVACIAVGDSAIALAPLVAGAVLRAPVFVFARAARRRRRAIDRDVPLLVDVLSLASFAGLAPQAALRRAVGAIDGPLADVLSAALIDIDLGARWRDRLVRLADGVPITDLRRTIALLVRTESIGAATTEPFVILADEIRAARRSAASERARKAPVQMLFPLVFLVLPAFLLLPVVPVLVATLGSIW